MQLKDLPGGMDANQLAREHAKTKQLSPEQTEILKQSKQLNLLRKMVEHQQRVKLIS